MSRFNTKSTKPKKRNLFSILLVIIIVIGLLITFLRPQSLFEKDLAEIEVTGAPRIKVATETIDYGNVNLGEVVYPSIKVTNVGDQILEFKEPPYIELQEGCCPPIPAIRLMTLDPGESTIVSFPFSMHNDSMSGFHDFRLYLPTNDPTEPEKVVTILSNWIP